MTINDSLIKKAIRFAKIHRQIHQPLKTKPLTAEIIKRRDERCAKIHRQIFGY